MKIVTISDIHGKHHALEKEGKLFPGDMIICAGDVSRTGSNADTREFIEWFANLDYKYKILIAGNHDWDLEKNPKEHKELCENLEIHYLDDSGIEIEGIKIWGSPVQPKFNNWAFNRFRGDDIKKHWDLIPDNIDILITHGPPGEILDQVHHYASPNLGQHVGCYDLYKKICELDIKLHIFGHVHEGRGVKVKDLGKGPVTFVNTSVLDMYYNLIKENAPCFHWDLVVDGLSNGNDYF